MKLAFTSWQAFIDMGGYRFHVWSAFFITVFLLFCLTGRYVYKRYRVRKQLQVLNASFCAREPIGRGNSE